jgi:hypothetical protein
MVVTCLLILELPTHCSCSAVEGFSGGTGTTSTVPPHWCQSRLRALPRFMKNSISAFSATSHPSQVSSRPPSLWRSSHRSRRKRFPSLLPRARRTPWHRLVAPIQWCRSGRSTLTSSRLSCPQTRPSTLSTVERAFRIGLGIGLREAISGIQVRSLASECRLPTRCRPNRVVFSRLASSRRPSNLGCRTALVSVVRDFETQGGLI